MGKFTEIYTVIQDKLRVELNTEPTHKQIIQEWKKPCKCDKNLTDINKLCASCLSDYDKHLDKKAIPKCQYCDEPANNGTMTMCNAHTDLSRQHTLFEKLEGFLEAKKENSFYIPDGTDLGSESDERGWRNYEVHSAQGKTKEELLENLTVSEVDQDGGEIDCYGFEDTPNNIQDAISNLMTAKASAFYAIPGFKKEKK